MHVGRVRSITRAAQFTHLRMTVSSEQKRVYHRVNTLLKYGITLDAPPVFYEHRAKKQLLWKRRKLARNNNNIEIFILDTFNSVSSDFFRVIFIGTTNSEF